MLELIRGDRRDLIVAGLVDRAGAPATFTASDILRWTAKRYFLDSDDDALIVKSSEDDGIVIDVGAATATVNIWPDDWDGVAVVSRPFVWDLQLTLDGDVDDVQTIAREEGSILADVTRTYLAGS